MDWWIWVVAGLVLLVAELALPGGFYLFFFGCGAVAVGLLAAGGWAQPLWLQGVLFTGLSLAALLLFRPLLVKRLLGGAGDAAVDSLVGELVVVRGAIAANGFGKAELHGTTWNARNAGDTAVGPAQPCRVERVEGLTLWIRAE